MNGINIEDKFAMPPPSSQGPKHPPTPSQFNNSINLSRAWLISSYADHENKAP